jgi:mRNA interferase MazF
MSAIPFGAIVLTDFPFTDLTAAKRRPALVISTNNDRRTDIVIAYITSVLRNEPDSIPIAPAPGTGLKVPSLVRFDKIATIDKNIISGRLGEAEPAWLADARQVFLACSDLIRQNTECCPRKYIH